MVKKNLQAIGDFLKGKIITVVVALFLLSLVGVIVVFVVRQAEISLRESEREVLLDEMQAEIEESTSELVVGFPSFPIYPGARLLSSYKYTKGEAVGYEATWIIDGSNPDYIEWYLDEMLKEYNWSLLEGPDEGYDYLDSQFFKFQKDGQIVNFWVIPGDGGGKTSFLVEFAIG